MRLIDANAFNEYIESGRYCENCRNIDTPTCCDCPLIRAGLLTFMRMIDEQLTIDAVDREDVISICNILGDKMDDEGRVAVEQIRDAVKDMRPYPKTCRDCKVAYDSKECYECTANIQNVSTPKEDDKCEKCEHCDYYSCPECETNLKGAEEV